MLSFVPYLNSSYDVALVFFFSSRAPYLSSSVYIFCLWKFVFVFVYVFLKCPLAFLRYGGTEEWGDQLIHKIGDSRRKATALRNETFDLHNKTRRLQNTNHGFVTQNTDFNVKLLFDWAKRLICKTHQYPLMYETKQSICLTKLWIYPGKIIDSLNTFVDFVSLNIGSLNVTLGLFNLYW